MKVIILAGGKGTRMLPITQDIPKVLIPIQGVPFLKLLIDRLKIAGFTELGIVVKYKKEMVAEFLKENHIEAKLFEQGDLPGTGAALLAAKPFIKDEQFLVCGGDNLWHPNDIKDLANISGNALAGLPVDNPSLYGVLKVENGKLLQIVEKPKEFVGNLINSGLYKLTSNVFPLLEALKPSPRGEYELTDALNQLDISVVDLKHSWLDLGKPQDIEKAELFLNKNN